MIAFRNKNLSKQYSLVYKIHTYLFPSGSRRFASFATKPGGTYLQGGPQRIRDFLWNGVMKNLECYKDVPPPDLRLSAWVTYERNVVLTDRINIISPTSTKTIFTAPSHSILAVGQLNIWSWPAFTVILKAKHTVAIPNGVLVTHLDGVVAVSPGSLMGSHGPQSIVFVAAMTPE